MTGAKKKKGFLDWSMAVLLAVQALLVIGKLYLHHRIMKPVPWWAVFIPAYLAAGIVILFLVVFGIFAATMSKWG